jgi:hypothetical protein
VVDLWLTRVGSRCAAQVHFILRHQNPVTGKWEEKHAKNVPAIKTDKKSHVYTLVIRPDNSWDILIDGKSEAKGRCDHRDFLTTYTLPHRVIA